MKSPERDECGKAQKPLALRKSGVNANNLHNMNRIQRMQHGDSHPHRDWRQSLYPFLILIQAAINDSNASPDPIQVAVSIPPQAYWVEKIGGERVSVHTILRPGESAETFSPPPSEINRLIRSEVVFSIGLRFEEVILKRIANRKDGPVVVYIGTPAPDSTPNTGRAHANTHAREGYHPHDPHVWMDPQVAIARAPLIRDTLVAMDRSGSDVYEANTKLFLEELRALHKRLRDLLRPLKNRKFLVYHPAFDYFARAYDMKQIALEKEGKPPSPRQLQDFFRLAEEEAITTIFVQPQFDRRAAKVIADRIGVSLTTIDPLAYDYVGNLEALAYALHQGMTE